MDKKKFFERPFAVVDLGSGRFCLDNHGHEVFNMEKNPVTGKYYGYCPPHGELKLDKLGAMATDDAVNDVLVIYVRKYNGSSNRVIVGFTDNATVYRELRFVKKLKRVVEEYGENVHCGYSVESATLYNLENIHENRKFIIVSSKYSRSMFHAQRFYRGTYPGLDRSILSYLWNYLNKDEDEEMLGYQGDIQKSAPLSDEQAMGQSVSKPEYTDGPAGRQVNKKGGVAKSALLRDGFRCMCDRGHETFMTAKGLPYMEGHHLIPCTCKNSEYYWQENSVNIDCPENVVTLCPTCHRKVHFGNRDEQRAVLKILYNKQKDRLKAVGLDISFEELLDLYL